jgi:hypothetical protein
MNSRHLLLFPSPFFLFVLDFGLTNCFLKWNVGCGSFRTWMRFTLGMPVGTKCTLADLFLYYHGYVLFVVIKILSSFIIYYHVCNTSNIMDGTSGS